MDPKPRPNHQRYIELLRAMTPEQRLRKAFEMSAFVKKLFTACLRKRHAELNEADFHPLWLKRLEKCHNRNW
jgi:hypothetical protein